MNSHLRAILWLLGLTLVVCSVLYPLVLWGIGSALFPSRAAGSLVNGPDGQPVGSRLIAQPFNGDEWFQPRPSAVGYNAAGSGGSNWGASNPKLRFRVARQLGPIVKYAGGPNKGQPVGPDVERWFAEKDRVATWAAANPTAAAEWAKTDDATKKYVADWAKANPDVLQRWKIDNTDAAEPPDPEQAPDAVAVPFLASFAARHPKTFPGLKDGALAPVSEGSEIQGVFFDAWLQEHPNADLEKVPADMVTASGSGLDPHITLRSARYQLDRVVAARAAKPGAGDPARIREQTEAVLREHAFTPLGGLVGEPLVNVLEVNLALSGSGR
jgi:potassium-transporting ATPase KdpC subunit